MYAIVNRNGISKQRLRGEVAPAKAKPRVHGELTPRQEQLLEFLRAFFVENWRMPTVRECCKELGITSPNGMACHLAALERKGAIKRKRFSARGIRLVGYKVEISADTE